MAEDPDSEVITATAVTAGNAGDAEPATGLLADILHAPVEDGRAAGERAEVYGDAAYGTGPLLAELDQAGVEVMVKVQAANAPGGRYSKGVFTIDLEARQVTCPNQVTAPIRPKPDGGGAACFGTACAACPLAAQCTTARNGRVITIGPHEEHLARGRARGTDPVWLAAYRATRPKVERKIAHLMRRRHGGRRARVRGRAKVAADFSLLAAATNIARLGVLGIMSTAGGNWTVTTG
ncbi:transposase [Streptomyces sp. NPDC055722]